MLSASGDKISIQGLAKYCRAHDLVRGRGKTRGQPVLVSFDEVRHHRAENYTREVMTGTASGLKTASGSPSAPAAPRLAAQSSNVEALGPAQRLKAAQAAKAELDLAQKRGELALVHEVDAGVAEIFSAQRTAGQASLLPWAERAAATLGLPAERVTQIRALGRELLREAERAFHTEAQRLSAATDEDMPSVSRRLSRLFAFAHRLRGGASTPAPGHIKEA